MRVALCLSVQGELKQAKKAGGNRLGFRVLGFKAPTHVLQMREHRKKDVSEREGWGQVREAQSLSSSSDVCV